MHALVQQLFATIAGLNDTIAALREEGAERDRWIREILDQRNRSNPDPGAPHMPPPPSRPTRRAQQGSGSGGRDVPGYDALDPEPGNAAAPERTGDWPEDPPENQRQAENGRGAGGAQARNENEWAEVARGRRKGAARPGPGQARGPDRRTPEQRKRDAAKAAADMLRTERPEPIDFKNMAVLVPDPRPLLDAIGVGAQVAAVRSLLQLVGVKRHVSGVTVAPNPGDGGPIVHLVIPAGAEPLLRHTFTERGFTVLELGHSVPLGQRPRSKQTPDEARRLTARRLAYLCTQSRSRRFQETALFGVPAGIRKEALEAYRVLVGDSHALLGQQGRPYSTAMEEVEEVRTEPTVADHMVQQPTVVG